MPHINNPIIKHKAGLLNIEQAVIAHAIEHSAHGQNRTSNELRKKGVFVSSSGVRSAQPGELQKTTEGA